MSVKKDETEGSPPQSIRLLEVATCTVAKLKIDWPAEKQNNHPKSKLAEHFHIQSHLLHTVTFCSSMIATLRCQDHGIGRIQPVGSALMSQIILTSQGRGNTAMGQYQ